MYVWVVFCKCALDCVVYVCSGLCGVRVLWVVCGKRSEPSPGSCMDNLELLLMAYLCVFISLYVFTVCSSVKSMNRSPSLYIHP